MSVQQSPSENRTAALPSELQSPRAKLVYLYLSNVSEASIDELQDALNIQKITLYSILRTLRKRELVEKDVDTFSVES